MELEYTFTCSLTVTVRAKEGEEGKAQAQAGAALDALASLAEWVEGGDIVIGSDVELQETHVC